MLLNFINKQISYFFSLRCFLILIKFMLMNFKLINLMLMNLVNKQISNRFPLRCFLMLFSVFWCFLVLFGAFLYLRNLIVKKKKNKKFKTGLMTLFILLLQSNLVSFVNIWFIYM